MSWWSGAGHISFSFGAESKRVVKENKRLSREWNGVFTEWRKVVNWKSSACILFYRENKQINNVTALKRYKKFIKFDYLAK